MLAWIYWPLIILTGLILTCGTIAVIDKTVRDWGKKGFGE